MLGLFVLVLIILLVGFVFYVKYDSGKGTSTAAPKSARAETLDDYVAAHGEPEAVFVLDVTRSNELEAVILAYEQELIIEGKPIARDKVTNVTFYNASNPYVNSEYQLMFTTTLPDKPKIKVPIGTDAEWAKQIAAQIGLHLNL